MNKELNEQQAKESLAELNKKIQENECLKSALQQEKFFYQDEKERLEKRYKELHADYESKKSQCDEAEKKLKESNEINKVYESNLNSIRLENTESTEKIISLEFMLERLNDNYQLLKNSNNFLNKVNRLNAQDYKQNLLNLQNEIDHFEKTTCDYKFQINTIENRLTETSSELMITKEELNKVQNELNEKTNEIDSLSNRIHEYENEQERNKIEYENTIEHEARKYQILIEQNEKDSIEFFKMIIESLLNENQLTLKTANDVIVELKNEREFNLNQLRDNEIRSEILIKQNQLQVDWLLLQVKLQHDSGLLNKQLQHSNFNNNRPDDHNPSSSTITLNNDLKSQTENKQSKVITVPKSDDSMQQASKTNFLKDNIEHDSDVANLIAIKTVNQQISASSDLMKPIEEAETASNSNSSISTAVNSNKKRRVSAEQQTKVVTKR